jgi:hypothetical protein
MVSGRSAQSRAVKRQEARIQTIMASLGHRSANMAMTYARISDPEVRRQYEIALTNGSRISGPAEDAPCIDFKPLGSHPTNVVRRCR